MSRVKRGVTKRARRKKVIKQAKGYKWRRKSTFKAAKQAVMKALKYSYRDRKTKKRVIRRDWQDTINQAVRKEGISYSRFMNFLKKEEIELNRKMLAWFAKERPEVLHGLAQEYKQANKS